jgi:IS30 family transposase
MKHLTAADRGRIETLHHLKHSNADIARKLGIHKSTVGREINRGLNMFGRYDAEYAQELSLERQTWSYNTPKLSRYPELANYVIEHIKSGWDPSQIAGRLRSTCRVPRVCQETIYNWVYNDPHNKSQSLYQYLRFGKKTRGNHYNHERTRQQFKLPNRVSIHERPQVVRDRTRLGDWEADTVLFPQKHLIVTAYERLSGLALFQKLHTKQARVVCPVLGGMLAATKSPKTLTLDNGVEFYHHHAITAASGAEVYFADTYASHQRGGNENLNRQLRAFLPKSQDIRDLTVDELQEIQDEINNKPRRRHDWRTPNEVYKWLANNPNRVLDLKKVAFDSRT